MDISFFEKKPKIDDVEFEHKFYKNLKRYDIDSIPNFIFHGNKGCGKSIKIYAFLCSILDEKVYTLKNNEVEIEKKTFKFKSSIYHLEIDCLELVNNERVFFSNYLKDYCNTRNIGLDMPKIIILINIEKINKNSLLSLRKLIETTYKSAKYILETSSISNIPDTLITRFFSFRIPSPKREEVESVIKNTIKINKIKITKSNLNKIIDINKNYKHYYDLNDIFIALNYYYKTNKILINNNHKIICEIIGILINKKLNFNVLPVLKNICEKIFINCSDVNEIVLSINKILCERYKENISICENIIKLTVECNINLANSTGKYFIHLENYFVKLILLLNN